jgi:hypothetical protein
MINKINMERRRSMNVTLHNPATRTSGKESRSLALKVVVAKKRRIDSCIKKYNKNKDFIK